MVGRRWIHVFLLLELQLLLGHLDLPQLTQVLVDELEIYLIFLELADQVNVELSQFYILHAGVVRYLGHDRGSPLVGIPSPVDLVLVALLLGQDHYLLQILDEIVGLISRSLIRESFIRKYIFLKPTYKLS